MEPHDVTCVFESGNLWTNRKHHVMVCNGYDRSQTASYTLLPNRPFRILPLQSPARHATNYSLHCTAYRVENRHSNTPYPHLAYPNSVNVHTSILRPRPLRGTEWDGLSQCRFRNQMALHDCLNYRAVWHNVIRRIELFAAYNNKAN